ncbi:hypothetical protein HBN50_14790 [Halobacteriovorax sp. GB3]|uniref:hypothetical protein n=1 Tax=Halobacteriovorax sp. GB3 TaxID=2719615 RepID=UPI00235F8F8E|nr:hypothetical protein [Halobacteriovorax sp. GB3]MDD0854377.1 hypothetical protein [Halobacteriovorax sp. GB3]
MNLKSLNRSMYLGAYHLLEASKHLGGIDPEFGQKLATQAMELVNSIIPEEEKVSDEKLDSLLDEILNADLED